MHRILLALSGLHMVHSSLRPCVEVAWAWYNVHIWLHVQLQWDLAARDYVITLIITLTLHACDLCMQAKFAWCCDPQAPLSTAAFHCCDVFSRPGLGGVSLPTLSAARIGACTNAAQQHSSAR